MPGGTTIEMAMLKEPMRWRGRKGSFNVNDRRGAGGIAAGGGIIGVIILIVYSLLGGDPSQLQNGQSDQPLTQEQAGAQDTLAQFVSVVLAETETTWHRIFEEHGSTYQEPKMVLFRGQTQSGCGFASAASGPFYCPADNMVYIDLSFYSELRERFGATGDFAMAYVVAHEVGHHVQTLMGTSDKVHQLRERLSEKEYNRYSVMLELQADFYAGVWAYHAKKEGILDAGDIEEALNAASAIGDDRLQKQSQGYVVPDAFTHGTSQQRMYWFKRGFESGDITKGDTFSDPSLQ
jgi:predicted metalloprotease